MYSCGREFLGGGSYVERAKSADLIATSFFGTQEGKFKVELVSIAAVKRKSKSEEESEKTSLVRKQGDQAEASKGTEVVEEADAEKTSWISWLSSQCVVS